MPKRTKISSRRRRFETLEKKNLVPVTFFIFSNATPLDSPSHNARSRGSPHLQPSPPLGQIRSFCAIHDPRATQPLMRVHYIPVPDVRAKIAIGSRTFGVVVWDVPAPHYAATCTVDQRELRERGAHCRTSGSHPPAACHPIGKGHTGRNVNGHLIATRERIVIRVHRDSNHLAKSSVMGSRGRWGGEFVGRKVDRERNFSKKWTKLIGINGYVFERFEEEKIDLRINHRSEWCI